MRHPLLSCRQCSRFLLRLFVSILATTFKKVAIAEDPPKIVTIAGNFAVLPQHALRLDQHPRCLCSYKYCSPVDNNILAFMQVNMRNAYLPHGSLGNHRRFPITWCYLYACLIQQYIHRMQPAYLILAAFSFCSAVSSGSAHCIVGQPLLLLAGMQVQRY